MRRRRAEPPESVPVFCSDEVPLAYSPAAGGDVGGDVVTGGVVFGGAGDLVVDGGSSSGSVLVRVRVFVGEVFLGVLGFVVGRVVLVIGTR